MRLFLRIKNGQPFEHPIVEYNFVQAFPDVDLNNLPPDIVEFKRVEPPALGVYQKNLTVTYKKVGEFWTDVFSYDVMTSEEKAALQQETKGAWAANNGPASWTFNEEICAYVPPVPVPDDLNQYAWRESDLSWVFVPDPPKVSDGGVSYIFNVETERWEKAAA